eukprot:s60_g65.t1
MAQDSGQALSMQNRFYGTQSESKMHKSVWTQKSLRSPAMAAATGSSGGRRNDDAAVNAILPSTSSTRFKLEGFGDDCH